MGAEHGKSRNSKRKPDKFINSVPHRECGLCYMYKPEADFSVVRKRTITFRKEGSVNDNLTSIKRTFSTYCKPCAARVQLRIP